MPLVERVTPDNSVVQPLLEVIKADNPAGEFDEESAAYILIEDEMIKFGGLQSASIEWEAVEKSAKQLLIEKHKHLRVITHLIQCWLRKESWMSFIDSCDLLSGFCETFFETSFPRPGAKGLANKRRQVATNITRLKASLDELTGEREAKETFSRALQSIEALQKIAQTIELGKSEQDTLDLMHIKAAQWQNKPKPSKNKPKPAPNQQGGQTISPEYFSTPKAPVLSASDERELRRNLLDAADAANQQDFYDPIGYGMRRHALWGPISSPPMVSEGRRTELLAVRTETVMDYQEAIDSNRIDPELLLRIEKSVASSVYWFKGSYFASQVAKKLEMDEVAQIIWQATVRFVRRVPSLLELQFNDEQPFIDAETKAWISAAPDVVQTGSVGATPDQDYAKRQEELTALMEKEGVEAVLKQLEKMQEDNQTPRQQCQMMKIVADLLSDRGLKWFSDELYYRIEKSMTATNAAQWEPELYKQVALQINEKLSKDSK